MKLPALVLALLAASACGSKATAPTEAPKDVVVAWADMDADARREFMKQTVLPTMKAKFVAFDAEEFGEMDCKTCHGAGAEDDFAMPNADLKKLDFAHMDQLTADEQKAATFMHEVVVPEMAALLGEQPYDQATQKGFGCTDCHMTVDAK